MDKTVIHTEPLNLSGFDIYVSNNHAFGTDAVLLANFANPQNTDKAVDLGTGCGIIPYLMLRDNKLKYVYGVDISQEAVCLANKTAAERGLTEKAAFICSDLKDLKGKVPFGGNTLVTCNPPYFKNGAAIKNNSELVTSTRHETLCNLEDVVSVGAKLLQTSGRLCLCNRPDRLTDIICLMRSYGVEAKRIRLVCQRKGEEPWLVLVEGKRSAKPGVRFMPTLYVEEKGEWSSEMLEIYGPYKMGR